MASTEPTQGDSGPRRVILWTLPRTVSTAFTKCMSFVDGIQVIHEPYGCAHELELEKSEEPGDFTLALAEAKEEIRAMEKPPYHDYPLGFDDQICTYEYVKQLLEQQYPGKKLIFCKAMSRHLDGKYDMIPNGYHHTFLIRNPVKCFYSWRKLLMDFIQVPEIKRHTFRVTDLSFPITTEYQVLAELYQHVKEQMNADSPAPVIIDADDLQNFPENILRQYLEAIGIQFDKTLLGWDSSDMITYDWVSYKLLMQFNALENRGGFFNKALASSQFHPPKAPPPKEQLTPDVIECVEASLKYYNMLHEMRNKP